jgi:hypothetical protein
VAEAALDHDEHRIGHLHFRADAARMARHHLRDGRGVRVEPLGKHAGHQIALRQDALHRAGAVDDEHAAAVGARHRARGIVDARGRPEAEHVALAHGLQDGAFGHDDAPSTRRWAVAPFSATRR